MNYVDPTGKARPIRLAAAACAALIWVATSTPASAIVEVNVTRVGFPTVRTGDVVRNGAWVPIIADLALISQQGFDGTARVSQFDNDGDEYYDSVEVHLRADAGGTRRYFLYVPANPRRAQGGFFVELVNTEGETVQVLSQGELTYRAEAAQRPQAIGDDDIFILSISRGAVGRIADLVDTEQQAGYARPVHVGHMGPVDLPELWIGLEIVDYIVWDDAHPEDLTERQLAALLQWVRQGGTLMLAASRSAGSVVLRRPLAEVLPVDLGEIIAVDNLSEVRRKLVGWPHERARGEDGWNPADFPNRVAVVRCAVRKNAKVLAAETNDESGQEDAPLDVITRRSLGKGQIIFSAVTLKDLFSGEGSAVEFFRRLLHLPLLENPDLGRARPLSLFSYVAGPVSFSTSGSLYLFAAGICSIAYLVLATFGTWGFLAARRWCRHSWTVFAAVAVAVSVISSLVVNSLQGFGEKLHQISIVDAEAGASYGQATVLFGLKTSANRQLDVWLPSNPLGATEPGVTDCFLRPIPGSNDLSTAATSFADPGEYRLVPASAVISDVRIRATLKQFEGRWAGPLGGRVTGEVSFAGRQIAEGSYIVNQLGVDLERCYLLHTLFEIPESGISRSSSTYAYALGPVPGDGRRIELRPLCYKTLGDESPAEIMRMSTLAKRQGDWAAEFDSLVSSIRFGERPDAGFVLGKEQSALLLLSTIGEFDPINVATMSRHVYGIATWSRDRLRTLDLREQLQPDSVILLGFAEDPGPARLFARSGDRHYRMLKPDRKRSQTMYRIRIPVTVAGDDQDPSVRREH